jgi:predicted  nucleic acid-binding Zn-ribbon protein
MARRNTMREGISHRPSISAGSPLSARGAVKTRPVSNDETELENAAILEDLRSRLAKSESAAETAAQEYTKQIKALQQRLGEANADYVRIEDQMHAKDEATEQLEMQVKDLIRSKRDQENIYEAEVSFHLLAVVVCRAC